MSLTPRQEQLLIWLDVVDHASVARCAANMYQSHDKASCAMTYRLALALATRGYAHVRFPHTRGRTGRAVITITDAGRAYFERS